MMISSRLSMAIYRALASFNLAQIFTGSSSGFLPDPSSSQYNRQTYNAPATAASAAGDPVGIVLPSQVSAEIVNWLYWSDGFSQSDWTKTNVTVTANTRNDSGVGNANGASPVADTLNATVAGGSVVESFTCAADTATKTASIDLEAGTATNSTLSLSFTGGNTYTANIAWSGGVPTVTHAGSAGSSDVGATLQATGIYKIWVRGANDNRTTCTFTLLPAASGTGTVYASRAQVNDGSSVATYQPNAGALGGSNVRDGGGNQVTWSQDVSNPGWTKTATSAVDNGTVTATATTAVHLVQQSTVVTVSGVQYTYALDLVRGTHDFFQIYANTTAGAGYVNYNINALTKSETTATGTIADNGDGSVRISFTYTASATTDYPVFIFAQSLASARAVSWLAAGTETVRIVRAWRGFGSSIPTYSRNMDVLGGLLKSVVLYQTTSGNRVALASTPSSGIRNLATLNTENSSGWSLSTVTATDGTTIAPDGTLTGLTLTQSSATSSPSRALTLAASTTYNISIYWHPSSCTANWIRCRVTTAAGATSQYFSLSSLTVGNSGSGISGARITADANGWYRADFAYLPAAGDEGSRSIAFVPVLSNGSGTTDTGAVQVVWGFQYSRGADLYPYQKVTSPTLITETGYSQVNSYWQDGVSDYLMTGLQALGGCSLSPNASNAFTIFVAARTLTGGGFMSKNSGAAVGAQNFNWGLNSSGAVYLNARGAAATTYGSNLLDGLWHVFALRWNGTSFDRVIDSGSITAVTWTSASATDNTIEISVGIGRVSTSANMFGGYLVPCFVDRAVSDSEMLQGVAYLNSIYRRGL